MTMTTPMQEVKVFYRAHNKGSNEGALQDCQTAGYQALFMPQAADARIEGKLPWNQWVTTPSIRATGIPTGEQEAFTIYWHQPTAFATPEGITAAKTKGLVNGAGRLDQTAFDTIYSFAAAQNPHLIIPHRKLLELTSGPITLKAAATDSRVIAMLDGQERVARYLPAHAQAYSTKTIGVWHSDDLNHESPLARLLFLGYLDSGGLFGNGFLSFNGRFAGVRNASAEGATQKIAAPTTTQTIVNPTLETLLETLQPFIAPNSREAVEAELRKLYQP
ncbi:MAG: hypothetical protein Q8L34_04260 [Candidatus Woesearchaeota archaeon]|nr:hypothetical protein [Candidatus Woesearchaeota archaeon]